MAGNGKKQPSIARRTISVPFELDASMERHPEVNWSAIAKVAFENHLSEIEKKVVENMSDLVERLKASKIRVEAETIEAGKEAGRQWAKNDAEYEELQRLGDHLAAVDWLEAEEWLKEWLEESGNRPAFEFYAVIKYEQSPDNRDVNGYFLQLGIAPKLFDSPGFMNGFVAGAMEVWESVKDLI